MTDDEIRRIAEDAADKAVKKVFAILGVDMVRPSEVEQLRQTLRHAEWVRKVSGTSVMAAVGAIGIGIVAALWAGLQALLIKIGN